MRRAFVLLLLLGLMSGVSVLKAEATSTVDPLTLAAIGFVVLASFSAAEMGVRLGLPRVTGYIVSGLLLGPSALDILSQSVVDQMRMFNTLALGLIATAAGLELEVGQLRRVGRTLLATVGAKVVLAGSGVGLATWLYVSLFGIPSAPDAPGLALALAFVFGALSLGTSPAIVLAVLRDSRASGRLSDLALGAAVLKDVVVVVALAVAVAAAAVVLDGGAIDLSLLAVVGEEIVASLIAGAVVGLLLIAYIRLVHTEMLLFVSAMVLVVTEISTELHLERLLVFITAGFVVRNFSRHEHDLAPPLEMVSLPVFVVFFTIAGASVDLRSTFVILPLALSIVAARALTFWLAARFGSRFGREQPAIVANAYLAYLPQAGVTLGLVDVAARKLPAITESIHTTGTAVVALNLLIGPIALRAALSRAGELARLPTEPAPDTSDPLDLLAADEVVPAEPQVPEREALVALADAGVEDLELAALLRRLAADLDQSFERAIDDAVAPWANGTTRSVAAALGLTDEAATLRRWALTPQGDAILGHGTRARGLFDELRARLRALPVEIDVAMGLHELRPERATSTRARFGFWSLRMRARMGRPLPARRVPVRLAARKVLEPKMARFCGDMVDAVARAQGSIFEILRGYAADQLSAEDARRAVNKRMALLLNRLRADARHMLSGGLRELAQVMSVAGGPCLPAGTIRFSRVDAEVRAGLHRLSSDPAAWRERLAGSQHALLLAVELRGLHSAAELALERHLISPASEALGGVRQVILGVRTGLQQVHDTCAEQASPDLATLAGWAEACNASFAQKSHRTIETRLHAFRAGASIHRVAVELRSAVAALPERRDMVPPTTLVSKASAPDEIALVAMDIRTEATEHLIHGLLSDVDDRLDSTSRLLANTAPRLREAVDIALFAVESRLEVLESTTEDTAGMVAAFDRALARVDRLEAEIGETASKLRIETSAMLESAFARLDADIADAAALQRPGDAVGHAIGSVRRQLAEWAAPGLTWWRSETDRTVRWWRSVRDSRLGTELRARTHHGRLDAAGLREHTDRWLLAQGVPDAYARLFSLQPVREHRLFTAYRSELELVRRAERAWIEGGSGGSALIVGAHGAGRSSLLNMAELELTVPRVLRPEPVGSWRETGLDAALANELGCRAQRRSVLKALRKVRTAVLIDDLERWCTPDEAGLRALISFLDLMQRSRDSVFWLVTVTTPALRLVEEAVAVRPSFGHVLELAPLSHAELQTALLTRHALSGRNLLIAKPLPVRLMARLMRIDDGSLPFRLLARLSDGNLARAMVIWLRALEIEGEETVTPQSARMLTLGLPPFRELDPVQLAILLAVLRWGGGSPKQLADTLGVPLHVASQHAGFLRAAGMLESTEARRDELRVPRALVGPVIQGLRDVGTEP